MRQASASRAIASAIAIFSITLFFAAPLVAEESFSVITGWDQQLFPSYLLATATMRAADDEEAEENSEWVVLGDTRGVLGAVIEAPEDDCSVTVTIEESEYFEESTFSGTLASAGTVYVVYPRVRYNYRALVGNKQASPVSITYTVTIGDNEPESYTDNATLMSVNDCPYAMQNANDEWVDTSYLFAAYVNEQHPFVDKILREALDDGIVDSFTGYQSDDPAEVYRQVYALWHALTERDVRYSSITTSIATSESVYCQHVRLIDESINNRQANCVDGAVLFASMMREVDIEPVLVSVPRHCYVAFYLDKEHTQLIGLETTLIGSTIDDDPEALPGAKQIVTGEWGQESSWYSFCAAVVMGTADLKENKDKFNKEDPDYQLISVADARAAGVMPIAFDASSPFKSRAGEK